MVVQPQAAFGDPNDEAELRKRIDEIQAIQASIDEAKLLEPWRAVGPLIEQGLPARLEKVRSQGYAYLSALEHELSQLGPQWARQSGSLELALQTRARPLAERLADARQRLALIPTANAHDPGWRARCDQALAEYRKEAGSLGAELEKLVQPLVTAVQQIERRIGEIEYTMRQTAEATFPFDRTHEHVFVALKAEWQKGKSARENPDGILFVTNKRILMERKEKEGGFLGLGGKKVQGLVWEIPIEQIDGIRPEKRGLLGGVDLIHIRPKPGAGFSETTVEIKGHINAHEFAASLQPVLDGSLTSDLG